jgi:hypothetical protein
MPEPELHSPPAFSELKERRLIFLLCCLTAVHVFIFSAAFPLFNNMDEQTHFDLVVKYSENGVPRALEPLSQESLRYIVLFSTLAYFANPTNLPDGRFPPPPWTQPAEKVRQALLAAEKFGSGMLNYEASQPPVYYELAGFWWRLGKWCGIHDGYLPYWIRFLNMLLMPALVWVGYAAAKSVFQENLFARMAVPALLAFMPESAFYSIENDVLSPLCFGLAFVCLMQFWRAKTPDIRLGIITGLALAATFLTKMTNLPILAVSLGFVLLKIRQLAKTEKMKLSLPPLAALFICAGLPAVIWMIWCKCAYGDFTGSQAKVASFGWTHKPFAEWWHHPIFTPGGFWIFLSVNLASFWQGEMMWHGKQLALPPLNVFYVVASMVFIAIALFHLSSKSAGTPRRHALWFAFAGLAAAFAFFGFLSVIYDFHDFFYPSREHPYFTSGRLMLGVLIPFMLLFVFGFDRALNHFGNAVKFSALAAMILLMIAGEIITDWPVFANEYNWFHL